MAAIVHTTDRGIELVERVRRAGVVGAGGAGFPTHVKLAGRADTVIANGAECEPLLHKDAAVMEHEAGAVVRGLQLAMEMVQARTGVVGVKAKNAAAVAALRDAIAGTAVQLRWLGDYYPAGDEYDLVHEVTGRVIPPGGIPLHVGVVVCNVETLANVAHAVEGRAVTHKTLTVAGAVREPVTLRVPIGTSLRECLALAGGTTTAEPVACIGGVMMGETTVDFDRPVLKTTGGVIVLPRAHRLVQRKLKPAAVQHAIGRSACDQCRYCTEYCPRFLLGYAVEPHRVMRSLAFTAGGRASWDEWAALCCACGLCTLYACPEELYPKEACDQAKVALRAAGIPWSGPTLVNPHPMRDGRRVPIAALLKKLALDPYDAAAPLRASAPAARRLVLPLKQGSGVAARLAVRSGERVAAGQMIADVAAGELGSALHAPLSGRVAAVEAQLVAIDCDGA